MGDCWMIDHGPRRGVYFEEKLDLDAFLERVPRLVDEHRKNPILAGLLLSHTEMQVRLATPQEMVEFRMQEFRKQQQQMIRRKSYEAEKAGLPNWAGAFMLNADKERQR
jgi:hypothetical protein